MFENLHLIFLLLLIGNNKVHALDESVIERIIDKVRLVDGTDQFERWKELQFPLKFKIYAFNIKNPDEIMTGAKPIVKEVGPFVYNMYPRKEDIQYDNSTDQLTYKKYLSFEFDEENSAADENMEITVLNMAVQDVLLTMDKFDETGPINENWDKLFHEDGLFITIPARSFFFDGYQFCKTAELQGVMNTVARTICSTIKIKFENSKFLTSDIDKIQYSLFGYKEDRSDGEYEISAGNEAIELLGEISSWNGLIYLNTWNDDSWKCNLIRGTDSTIYRPFNDESSNFEIFDTDTCRVWKLKNGGTTTYDRIEGIIGRIDPSQMSNTDDNSCYCIKKIMNLDGEFECLPEGFSDMSTCLGSQTVVSLPHMLWADETYRDTVTGLKPDEDRHSSFAIIEKYTGIPLQAAIRKQYNMIIRPIGNIKYLENITPAVIPIAWVEQEYTLSHELYNELEELLENLVDLGCQCLNDLPGRNCYCFIENLARSSFCVCLSEVLDDQDCLCLIEDRDGYCICKSKDSADPTCICRDH